MHPLDPVPSTYTADLAPAPAVSIIIPAWRCEDVIRGALDSALAQSFTDREVIVVNDGCPNTRELEGVLTHYRHDILYMRQPHAGPSAARNRAMEFARGRYLAFLDSDDSWSPGFLARLVPLLERDRALDVVYSDAVIAGGARAGRRFMQAFPSRGAVTFERVLEGRCTILTSGAVARAALVREVGPFDESLGIAEDYDFWLRMLLGGARFAYVREPLTSVSLRENRLCADVQRAERGVLAVLEKLGRRRDLGPAQRAAVEDAERRVQRALAVGTARRNPLRGWMRGSVGT